MSAHQLLIFYYFNFIRRGKDLLTVGRIDYMRFVDKVVAVGTDSDREPALAWVAPPHG